MIAAVSKTSKIVVEKSTVPVKTAEAIAKVGGRGLRGPGGGAARGGTRGGGWRAAGAASKAGPRGALSPL
jgi:hypothetical protein